VMWNDQDAPLKHQARAGSEQGGKQREVMRLVQTQIARPAAIVASWAVVVRDA
jgi:hypothetical protein